MTITPIQTRLVRKDENLCELILASIPAINDGCILAVTSKIVALSQGRVVENTVDKETLIREESEWSVPTQWATLAVRDGMVMPNAGIDESNADGKYILAPEKPFEAADGLRTELMGQIGVARLGILITDSRVAPLRSGTIGIALGYAGFRGLRDYIGKADLFGRPERMTRLNIADNLASSAVLAMGEAAEQTPLARIDGAPVEWTNTVNPNELRIDPKDDLYGPLFRV